MIFVSFLLKTYFYNSLTFSFIRKIDLRATILKGPFFTPISSKSYKLVISNGKNRKWSELSVTEYKLIEKVWIDSSSIFYITNHTVPRILCNSGIFLIQIEVSLIEERNTKYKNKQENSSDISLFPFSPSFRVFFCHSIKSYDFLLRRVQRYSISRITVTIKRV